MTTKQPKRHWFVIAQDVRFETDWTCEECHTRHGQHREADGTRAFVDVFPLDGNREHTARANLRALCQICAQPYVPATVARVPETQAPLFLGMDASEFSDDIKGRRKTGGPIRLADRRGGVGQPGPRRRDPGDHGGA